MKIKSNEAYPVASVYEAISDRERESMDFNMQIAYDHASKYKLKKSEALSLKKKIMAVDPSITDDIATKIIDVLPRYTETLDAILVPYKIKLEDGIKEKIISLVKEVV
jgi:DNA-directed RNA polymerase subunit F